MSNFHLCPELFKLLEKVYSVGTTHGIIRKITKLSFQLGINVFKIH